MKPLNVIDYHMHTAVTVDGKMTEAQACEQAAALGVYEIAFTNHVMLKQPAYLTTLDAYTSHWLDVQECQRRYPHLKIKLGIEIDYYPGWEKKIAGTLRAYQEKIGRPFDVIIGAIHELNGVFFSNSQQAPRLFENRDLLGLYRDYFKASVEAVRCGLFDLIAHPDLIKRYTHELTPPVDFELYQPEVLEFVDALLDSEVGMEVNMKGMKLKVGEPFPSRAIVSLYLARARFFGREPILTLGSDAHAKQDVGLYLQDGAQLLLECGQQSLVSFDLRKRSPFLMVQA